MVIKLGAPQETRSRYIAFKVKDRQSISEVKKTVFKHAKREDRYLNKARILFYDWNNGFGLIKCSHIQKDRLRRKLENINDMYDGSNMVKILGISGTIKKAKQKFSLR